METTLDHTKHSMTSLSEYLNERVDDIILEDKYVGSSDKAIYARLAQHKYNHLTPQRQETAKKNYPGIPNNKDAMVKWFKETNGKLVPKNLEIIPRSKWNQLEQVGEIESSLMSPDKWTYFEYICKNPRKTNKILTILECSNSKPYCQDQSKQMYFDRYRWLTDFACGAYGVVPEEYSQLYPVREDEWAHSDESESVALKYNIVSANRGIEYLKTMGYEHIIVFFQNPAPEEFVRWMEADDWLKSRVHYICDSQLRSLVKKNHPGLGKNDGLLTQRLVLVKETQDKFERTLKKLIGKEDREKLNEYTKLRKADDKTGMQKWEDAINKEYGIEPYETDKPLECKLKKSEIPYHDRTSDIEQKLQKEYKSYIKKFVEVRKSKEISKDTNLYKQRLVFTPLDLLVDKYELGKNNPYLKEIDKKYWNMMKAIEDVASEYELDRVNKDKYGRYDYLWTFKSVIKEFGKDELIKYCDKEGLSQFDQDPKER